MKLHIIYISIICSLIVAGVILSTRKVPVPSCQACPSISIVSPYDIERGGGLPTSGMNITHTEMDGSGSTQYIHRGTPPSSQSVVVSEPLNARGTEVVIRTESGVTNYIFQGKPGLIVP